MKRKFFIVAGSIFTLVLALFLPNLSTATTAATTARPSPAATQATPITFSDTAAHRYQKAIEFIVSRGLAGGYPDGTFRPDKTLSRAELLKLVMAQNYSSAPAKNCFTDVKKELWYSKFACKAKELGIVQGYADGSFQGGKTVTFVEALKMLITAYQLPFEVSPPPNWFKNGVEFATDRNIIPLSVASFNQEMTRGEMAEMITRFIQYYEGTLKNYLGPLKNQIITYDILRTETLKKTEQQRVPAEARGIEAQNCYTDPSICRVDQLCIQNSCIKKTTALPSNTIDSETHCAYDQVYRNGACEKAKFNILFTGSALSDATQFNDFIEKSMAGFIAASPLKLCPDRVRIHREINYCAPSGIEISEQLRADRRQTFDAIFILHPPQIFDEKCSKEADSISLRDISHATLTHELGHVYGLWDQYCYWPTPENPNPANFTEAECKPAKNDAHFEFETYCRIDHQTAVEQKRAPASVREDRVRAEASAVEGPTEAGQTLKTYTPYQCLGNFNPLGGRSIMGVEHSLDAEIDYPLFGFTKQEFDVIATKLNCD